MDDKEILKSITPHIINLKFFTYEGVRTVTFAIIKKDELKPCVVHYESTNRNWRNFYINAPESKLCHIMRKGVDYSKKFDQFTLVWNLVPPDNEESIFINEKRIDLDHCNGLSICKNISNELILATLFSGAEHDVNFVQTLLKNKHSFLKKYLYKWDKVLWTN